MKNKIKLFFVCIIQILEYLNSFTTDQNTYIKKYFNSKIFSFFFSFSIYRPKTVLPSSSSSPSSNIQTLLSKSQTQKSRSQNRSKNPNQKFMISTPKHHGFDDLGTKAAWVCWSRHQRSVFYVFWFGLSIDSFSIFSGLVCLWWNIFCCGFVNFGLVC